MGEAVTVIGTAITTLGLIAVAIIRQGGQARDSKREGVKGGDVQPAPPVETASAADEPREGFRDLAKQLQEEIARLREDRAEDRAEVAQLRTDQNHDRASHAADMEEMRAKHAAVVEENRHFRVVILAVMEQLRRIPPPEHSEILTYLLTHLPGLGKDPS